MNRTWVAILLCSFPLSASAAGETTIPKVVPYADGVGSDAIRKECAWDKDLSKHIVRYSKRKTVVIAKDPSVATGKVLTLTITKVHATGSGRYTGAKFADLQGELREGGQLIGSFKAARQTTSTHTTCGALDRVGKALGKDIAEWLKAPTLDARLGDEK